MGGLRKPIYGSTILSYMEASLHDYVVEKLRTRPRELTYAKIEDATQIKKKTIGRIARRNTANPGVSNIEKLAQFFRSKEANTV